MVGVVSGISHDKQRQHQYLVNVEYQVEFADVFEAFIERFNENLMEMERFQNGAGEKKEEGRQTLPV